MERDSTPRLDRTAFQALQAQWDLISQFDSVFHSILEPDVEFVRDTIDRCLEKIAAFEPNVSIIGQVKAGKSTLLNAMVGKPDFHCGTSTCGSEDGAGFQRGTGGTCEQWHGSDPCAEPYG